MNSVLSALPCPHFTSVVTSGGKYKTNKKVIQSKSRWSIDLQSYVRAKPKKRGGGGKHTNVINNHSVYKMCDFLFTKLTEQTAVLQPDHGNCQPFGQLNATVESWILSYCPLFPAFSKQKCPFSLFPERPGSFANLFSQKFARIIVIFGHFNVKIALAVPLGAGTNLQHPRW